MNNSPCKGCTDRFVKVDFQTGKVLNCHTNCQKYLEYKKLVDEESAKAKREKQFI